MNRICLSKRFATVVAISLSIVGAPGPAHGATASPAPAPAAPAAQPASYSPVYANGVPTQTFVVTAKNRKTPIFATKGATTPAVTLDNFQNFSGRHVFVVLLKDGDWFQVKVPTRPNGRTGWVRAADVNLFQHDYGVVISLGRHQLTVYKAGVAIQTETVAVGQSKYPTPTGSFFIRELARPGNPRGAYGPWAFGLSAYSNVLTRFGRGDGQIGIHGTNAPKALGTNASHGCIRVSNTGITKMAQTLPQGVPVEIVA